MDTTPNADFSGLFLTPDTWLGDGEQGQERTMGAFLAYCRQRVNPKTQADHLLVREWALIQWRLQCLAQMEEDWWHAYSVAMDDSWGDSGELVVEPASHLQACSRAVASFERMVRLEARFKKREAQLLPLMQALMTESPVVVKSDAVCGMTRPMIRESEASAVAVRLTDAVPPCGVSGSPQNVSLKLNAGPDTNAVSEIRSTTSPKPIPRTYFETTRLEPSTS